MKLEKVICQEWEWADRWSHPDPTGCTLHLTAENHIAYVTKIYAGRSYMNVPDEYLRTSGASYEMEVDKDLYKRIKDAGGCLQLPQSQYERIKKPCGSLNDRGD